MGKDTDRTPKSESESTTSKTASKGHHPVAAPAISKGLSRRGLLAGASVVAATAASLGLPSLTGRQAWEAKAAKPPPKPGKGKGKGNNTVLLKNCLAVLSMEGEGSPHDMAGADILIQDGKIVSITPSGGGGGGATGNRVVDCSTMIAMPGFITTHHHKYQTPQRSVNADGYIVFGGDPEQQVSGWPYESYSNIQNLWNQGRMNTPSGLWDLGFPSQSPEDVYIAHLVASLAELKGGITCATDTSQSSHTVEHTNHMIQGLIDSGQRNVYAYSGGINRAGPGHATEPDGFEFPGAIGESSWGVGRLRDQYFPTEDQLVTLCMQVNQNEVTNAQTGVGEGYSGWELAKHYGTWIDSHNIANTSFLDDPLMDDPEIGPKLTHIHCVRWGDPDSEKNVQIGTLGDGYPTPGAVDAWQKAYDKGLHVSIAVSIEMQMRHGRPPIQECLNVGIGPSLSPDVDCNKNGANAWILMRSFFDFQRSQSSDLAFPISDPGGLTAPQSVTCYQTLQAMTTWGAAGSGLDGNHHPDSHKVGKLVPGYNADIVLLETNDIGIAPANNAPGTVVTMMDPSHVRHVMVNGEFKVWNWELVGWNVQELIDKINKSRDDIIGRINSGPPIPEPGKNTPVNPYQPPFLKSCCFIDQNTVAPPYNLRG